VELGAGSGALTVPLATRCPHARVLACEINPALAQECRRQITAAGLEKRVDVLADSAQNLLAPAGARKTDKLDYIISGIPLANLGKEPTLALIETIHRALAEGGSYIQFQHSLVDRNKIRARFRHLRSLPVLLNFPPAVVYHAQK
jgi:phospholipid N-methyltransferase